MFFSKTDIQLQKMVHSIAVEIATLAVKMVLVAGT
jgi:hypothetical protein